MPEVKGKRGGARPNAGRATVYRVYHNGTVMEFKRRSEVFPIIQFCETMVIQVLVVSVTGKIGSETQIYPTQFPVGTAVHWVAQNAFGVVEEIDMTQAKSHLVKIIDSKLAFWVNPNALLKVRVE